MLVQHERDNERRQGLHGAVGWALGVPAALRAALGGLAALVALGLLSPETAHAQEPLAGNPLIEIAGGPFVFGSDAGEENEAPAAVVDLAPFRINKYEITNRLYAAFVEATGHRPAFYHNHPLFGRPDHPAVGLSWDDGNDFCRHYGLKLPTEQQWERAARGAEGRVYPWGDEPAGSTRANRGATECCDPDARDGHAASAPVGSYARGQTPEGVMDMAGNVWELVDGWYGPHDTDPAVRAREFRVLRGGAYNSHDWKLRTTYRLAYDGDFRFSASGGFRCVDDAESRSADTPERVEAAATVGPRAGPGHQLSVLAHDLAQPSGAARDGDSLILTDLASGEVVRRGAGGVTSVIHPGLPTGLDIIGEPTGPYKVQVREGRIFIAQGWQDVDRDEGPLDHALLEIEPGAAPRVISTDFWNPFDFEWGGDAWYVADGARNTVVRVTPDGSLSTLHTFAKLEPTAAAEERLSPTEFEELQSYEVDAVPTGVAVRDGRVFVALFGGFPFVAGAGAVHSVAADAGGADARVEITDLNAPTDIAFDQRGRLLVVEMGLFDMEGGFRPGTGRLVRIDLGSEARTLLLDGLTRPVTVVPMGDGAALVVQLNGEILTLTPTP